MNGIRYMINIKTKKVKNQYKNKIDMEDTLQLIVDDKFKNNIKRSIFVKDMKKYNIEKYKIKQKDGCFEIYIKKQVLIKE
jgi:hypothetical protein